MSMNVKRVGQIEGTFGIYAYNRTGGTRAKGDVAMLDVLGTQAETTNITEGDEASIFANLGLAATAGLASFPMYVLADDTLGDNELGFWIGCGLADVSVADDDTATTDVDRGDGLSVLNGAHDCEASATGNRVLGIALADAAASGSGGDASTIKAMWWGGRWGAGTVSA